MSNQNTDTAELLRAVIDRPSVVAYIGAKIGTNRHRVEERLSDALSTVELYAAEEAVNRVCSRTAPAEETTLQRDLREALNSVDSLSDALAEQKRKLSEAHAQRDSAVEDHYSTLRRADEADRLREQLHATLTERDEARDALAQEQAVSADFRRGLLAGEEQIEQLEATAFVLTAEVDTLKASSRHIAESPYVKLGWKLHAISVNHADHEPGSAFRQACRLYLAGRNSEGGDHA